MRALPIIPKIIGHRGAKGYAPENTFAAFRKAKELGAKWVEFDVQFTQDGTLVVIHDEDLKRTTNGSGLVVDTPWTEIEKLDAGSWFHPSFCKEKIPTLKETILLLKALNLGANVEIKPAKQNDREIGNAVADLIAKEWPASLPPPLVSSFSMDALSTAKSKNPELYIGALFENPPLEWQNLAKSVQASTIHLNHDFITAELVHEIKTEKYPLLAYTVNDRKRAEFLFHLGVTSIFTDFPWSE